MATFDIASALLILKYVAEGLAVSEHIKTLAQRVLNGETITIEELEKGQQEVHEAVDQLKETAAAATQGAAGIQPSNEE